MCTQPLFVDSNKLASIHARFLYCLPIQIQHQAKKLFCKITWRRIGAHQQRLIREVVDSGKVEWWSSGRWPLAAARVGGSRPTYINIPCLSTQQNNNGMSSVAMHCGAARSN
jgi:hypothetical protein